MNRATYTRIRKDGVRSHYYDYDYDYYEEALPDVMNWKALTPREQQVAWLACQPKTRGHFTNREIADRLDISPWTVKIHVRHVLSKLNLHSKAELRRFLAGSDFSEWQKPV